MAQEIADSRLVDTWASSGLIVEPDISKIIEGWQLGEQPPHEYMNWLQNTFGSKLNHILKNGVATWNNETEYLAGSSVQYNGNAWLCKTINTNSEPADVNSNWARKATIDNIYGFKNYIINGKKILNQRVLSSTDNAYNQDRWYKSGNNWYQGIEGINLVSGKKYTLSWVGTATASYYVGAATSSTINAQSFTAIANGGNFTLTISAGQNLWIKFASDSTGSTFNFVQLEEGLVATPFEQRPIGLELSLCQRYFQKSYLDEVSIKSFSKQGEITVKAVTTSRFDTSFFTFKVNMRTVPTMRNMIPNLSDTIGLWDEISVAPFNINVIGTISQSGFEIVDPTFQLTVGSEYSFHYIADAEL